MAQFVTQDFFKMINKEHVPCKTTTNILAEEQNKLQLTTEELKALIYAQMLFLSLFMVYLVLFFALCLHLF